MSFQQFTFPQVQHDLHLTLHDADLFASVPPLSVGKEFAAFLQDGVALALANSTEKAKSEFIIAPLLLELRRTLGPEFFLFSGVEWEADASRGLNGYCDFILTKGASQFVLEAPFVAIVEAKNDLIRTGLGQCIAAMVGAQVCIEKSGRVIKFIHGVVSTGSAWKFLRLEGSSLTFDVPEYYIDNPAKLMGILREIVRAAGTT
jgi:hypothetical protein